MSYSIDKIPTSNEQHQVTILHPGKLLPFANRHSFSAIIPFKSYFLTICLWNFVSCTKRKNTAPFCSRVKGSPLRTECSPRRNAVVLCNLVRHSTILPRQYQHFDLLPTVPPGEEAFYGGSVSLADYCPYLQEFTWKHKSVLVRGSRCSYEENTPRMIDDDEYGD
ncbi:hypothetical protein evm_012751 [Chilo suppressalis]|nr:hypothetical protein evm_012751 [Chilo suppressalis]